MNDKTKRNVLTTAQRYDLMQLVKFSYTNAGETDTGFAKIASAKLGLDISASSIKTIREGFGIEQIKAAPVAELKARIRELEAQLAAGRNVAEAAA